MLFNFRSNGMQELREVASFLHATITFDSMAMNLELAEAELSKVIGSAMMSVIETHYKSTSYKVEGQTDADLLAKDRLVRYAQLPVALLGYHSWMRTNDVQHTSTGRKVRVDPEDGEKMAWEWMLKRDEDAILEQAHRAIDMLITFLDEEEFAAWTSSTQYTDRQKLVVRSAAEFSAIYNINDSRRFFLITMPLQLEVQRKVIRRILGTTVYDALLSSIGGTPSEDQQAMLDHIRPAVVLYTMAMAMRRLSLEVLPSGVFQNYQELTQDARRPAAREVVNAAIDGLRLDAEREINDLHEVLRLQSLGEDYEPIDDLERHSEDNKFFRV